jgi:hypothetical protein
MKESATMQEIRKIRDEISLRHLKITPEERAREMDESVKLLVANMADLG